MGVVSWSFGMIFQGCDMIVNRGCNLSIAIGSLTLSSECVRVEGFAKYNSDASSARPPCARRKRFKAPLNPDGNDWDRVRRQNQADSRVKRLDRSVARQSSLGKPDQIVAAHKCCRAQCKVRQRAAALVNG